MFSSLYPIILAGTPATIAFSGTSLKEIYFEGNPEKLEKLGLPKGTVIYGIPGGTVEAYAKTYGYKFVDITKNS